MSNLPDYLQNTPRASRKYNTGSGKVWQSRSTDGFRKQFYFVYGTLMDPELTRKVLQRRDKPHMQNAKIFGYKIMMWGKYPALVDEPEAVVHGVAFEVETVKEKECLEAYETDRYDNRACYVYLKNSANESVMGRAFCWGGGKEELREGKFDLKDWKMMELEMKGR